MKTHLLFAAISASVTLSINAASFTVDFNTDASGATLTAGSVNIETDQPYQNLFGSGQGIQLTSGNPGQNPLNLYDTEGFTNEDTDLERNSGLGGTIGVFSGGNATSLIHGNALILNTNPNLSVPNDQGGGGVVTIASDIALVGFEFSYIDLDNPAGSSISLFNGAVLLGTIDFADLEDLSSSPFSNTGADFGDHNSNVITSITSANLATAFGASEFDSIVFDTAGSGAIGGLVLTTIPEPSTSAILALGFFSLLTRRSRK